MNIINSRKNSCKSEIDISINNIPYRILRQTIKKQTKKISPIIENNTVLIQHKNGISIGAVIPGKLILSGGDLAVDGAMVTVIDKDNQKLKISLA